MKRTLTRLGTSTRVPSNAKAKSPSDAEPFEPYFRGANVLTDPEFENFRDNSGGWYWWDREGGETRYTLPYLDLDCPSFLLWPDNTCADDLLVGWCQSTGPYELEEPEAPPPPPPPPDPENPPTVDTTPPAVPTGLVGTPNDGSVLLNWNDNGESDLASYRVFRSTSASGPFTFVISVNISNAVVSGLTNGTAYWFTVSAVDTSGNPSAQSAAAGPYTPLAPPGGDVTPPPVPTNLVVVTEGDRLVALNWDNSPASDFAHFLVKRATVSGGPYTTIATRVASDYTSAGLVNGTTYYFVVSAVDTSGNPSANSAEVDGTPVFTPDPDPPPPSGGGTGADGWPTFADRALTVNPGDDIDTKINSVPVGTIIGFAAGVHNIANAGAQFAPRNGERLVGATDANGVPTAILRGNWNGAFGGGGLESPFSYANSGAYATNVQFLRFMVERFAPGSQQCTLNGGNNWRIQKCWVHDNLSGGIRIGNNATAFGCKVYRNGQIGVKQIRACNAGVFDTCEVYENNYWGWNTLGFEAGGMKFAGGEPTNMVIRNCHFHHNNGPGIWYDFAGAGGLIENNISEFNAKQGIFYELCVGPGCIIRNNISRYNQGGAGEIYIANSTGAAGNPIIVENNITRNAPGTASPAAGIWLKDDPARIVRLGYVIVRGNDVTRYNISGSPNIASGHFGATTAPPGVNWIDNDYHIGAGVAWQWLGVKRSWSQWQALGFDTTGSQSAV